MATHKEINLKRVFILTASKLKFKHCLLQTLENIGGVRRNIEACEADLQAVVADCRDVLVSLIAEVGNNYLNLRGL